MRYSDRAYFIRETGGGYNPYTGQHEEATTQRDLMPVNITSMGIDRTLQLFGTMDKEILVIRTQRPYTGQFDRVEVNGKRYTLTRKMPHSSFSAFYVEEVNE